MEKDSGITAAAIPISWTKWRATAFRKHIHISFKRRLSNEQVAILGSQSTTGVYVLSTEAQLWQPRKGSCLSFQRTDRSQKIQIVHFLLHYLKSTDKVPRWIKRVHVFLDNASLTNKNQYMMGSVFECVQHDILNYFRVSFMIAGHTKFAPDRLFALCAKSFYASDAFSEADFNYESACRCNIRSRKNCTVLEGVCDSEVF